MPSSSEAVATSAADLRRVPRRGPGAVLVLSFEQGFLQFRVPLLDPGVAAVTEDRPGRIVHEVRIGGPSRLRCRVRNPAQEFRDPE